MAPIDCRTAIHPDAIELAEILRSTWPALSAELLASGLPLNEGDDDADADADKDADADADKDSDKDKDADDDKIDKDDDWQAKARKHERAAKRERTKREEAERKLTDRDKADQTDHEKAVEAAREEGKTEAQKEAEKERRSDRLEVAVTRMASKGVEIGEGDEAKTVKFADPEDAQLRIERAVSRGEIDADDIFDDEGRVKTEALTDELVAIATKNPHLVGEGDRPKPKGDPDARKGDTTKTDLESMTPEDHAKRKYGDKK